MYKCNYCNLTFEEKKGLSIHQKTKKCITHRDIGFFCRKCFKTITGYENTLKHVSECQEKIDSDIDMITALINQLAIKFDVNLNMENNNNGVITFKKMHNYIHPNKLECGVDIPQRIFLFNKSLNKYTDDQIMGSHNLYLNDIYNKVLRLDEPFQFLSVKYDFEDLMNILWFKGNSCFHINNDIIYVLGKVQCQNNNNQKWFGDTFNLKDNEKIVKCVWYKDPHLKQFFSYLKPLLKNILNLYLDLGNWALKQKKIKFKEEIDHKTKYFLRNGENNPEPSFYKIISDVMVEYNFIKLVDNIKILDCYDTFYSTFKKLLDQKKDKLNLYSNIQHVFKEEMLPSTIINEEYSLMIMNNPKFVGGNYYYLMDYILPYSEKKIFRSKE
jgi:hypothetical protein